MASKPQPLAINPGKGLGWFLLGISARDILTRLRTQYDIFPKIRIQYENKSPVTAWLYIALSENGLRLQFDGPDQRLRMIEVTDFRKISLSYKGQDLMKPQEDQSVTGPSFKQIYSKLFGPTFEGQAVADTEPHSPSIYVLSYPGIAFAFEVSKRPQGSDFVSVLSSPSTSAATRLSIFNGSSWKDAKKSMATRPCPHPRSIAAIGRPKDSLPDEIEYAIVKGKGCIEFRRRTQAPFKLVFGVTTEQDLILDLGPPDAIYRKNDRRLSIHKDKPSHRQNLDLGTSPEKHIETDIASISTATDYSSTEEESSSNATSSMDECFYNYYSHGFDILMTHKVKSSPPLVPSSDTKDDDDEEEEGSGVSRIPVATKLLVHGNVPGSYSFNHYRRCRWILDPRAIAPYSSGAISSETTFSKIRIAMQKIWSEDNKSQLNQPKYMVLNRGWGESPGSSTELVGGWEDAVDDSFAAMELEDDEERRKKLKLGNTELYGWPGLLFEVLQNDAVDCLTVY